MKPPAEAIIFLPSLPAKVTLSLSFVLSGGLYALLQYLQFDTLLPLVQAQKLSILLLSAIPLLIGSYATLYFVVHAYNNKSVTVTITEINENKTPNPAPMARK